MYRFGVNVLKARLIRYLECVREKNARDSCQAIWTSFGGGGGLKTLNGNSIRYSREAVAKTDGTERMLNT